LVEPGALARATIDRDDNVGVEPKYLALNLPGMRERKPQDVDA
jgi:hypothetical protein